MKKTDACLIDIWREANRHTDIAETIPAITGHIIHRIPLQQILILELDARRHCLETIAKGMPDFSSIIPERISLPADSQKTLLEWASKNQVLAGDLVISSQQKIIQLLQLPETNWMLGPLIHQGSMIGLLIMHIAPKHAITEEYREIAQILLEPFSIALENHCRFHELTILREAAETDKDALLKRLGRKEIADTIIGAETTLRLVMERVDMVSRSDLPVLILGETGTGKELIAREIHRRSPRSAGPILRINCGAIPPELIDSQLFGHERGSFTGALDTHKGWFERADGGTLFLDEIGELSLSAQVRLLRILQDGWLERVGGKKSIKIDVRIIAATHRDLAGMVSEGTFRQDLWYRIAVFPLLLPPLRERLDDMPVLARNFAERSAIRFSLPQQLPTDADIQLLQAYTWPGNIRELGSIIDRAALLGNGERLEISKALGITQPIVIRQDSTAPTWNPKNTNHEEEITEILPLDEIMRRHIQKTLDHTNGRIEGSRGAAVILQINPHTLRARMRKLGIKWTEFRKKDLNH